MSGVATLKMQLTPLQYSDNKEQQLADAKRVFTKGKQFPIKFGTEAGPETELHNALRAAAREHNHLIHFARGNFIAVDRSIVLKGSDKRSQIFVVKNDVLVGRQHDRVIPTLAFTHADPRIGRVALAGIHYSTKGRTPDQPNNDTNKMIADSIAEWMRSAGRNRAIAFAAGDWNMLDNLEHQDWAFGNEFTSIADELKKHLNTGHGPIDGFCSYNRDGRVTAKWHKVLNDAKAPMNSDHYKSLCAWSVKHKR